MEDSPQSGVPARGRSKLKEQVVAHMERSSHSEDLDIERDFMYDRLQIHTDASSFPKQLKHI